MPSNYLYLKIKPVGYMAQYNKNRMVPNYQWLVANFKTFNTKYFKGRLQVPKFSYNCPIGNWACYNNATASYDEQGRIISVKDWGEMAFTKRYYRKEWSVQNTLLHEMIHEYCTVILKIMPDHGRAFKKLAAKINRDGWKISEANDKKDSDVLVRGKKIPDIMNGTDENSMTSQSNNGSNFNEEAKRLFAELQQLRAELDKIKQQRGQMNECKKLIISEEQEKKLIKILKEEDSKNSQNPNEKRYCIDPNKVILLKRGLDNGFVALDYELLKGGDAKCIKIAGRLTPKTKQVIEKLYEEDLADWASDYCKNKKMFSDKDEREKFAKLVVNRWLNNKIGVHGMLDVNYYN